MITNASSFPEVYYGLHMVPGVAEYAEPDREPYRIFVDEETTKKMDPTFEGKPVYVEHVDEVNLSRLQSEADGYVVESFYNQLDGKHWAKFIVVSDKGKKAIRNGFQLSNAYVPKSFSDGGLWHGVQYVKEVTNAEYEHLALVKNPRYEESIILTPEEFKKYNEDKESELKKLANSKEEHKGEKKMGLSLKFFKKAKVENALDIESTVVELPTSKKEMTIADLVTKMDKIENMMGYAHPEHMVKVGENEMSVKDACNELLKLRKMHDEMSDKEHEAEEKEHMEKMANDPEEKSTVEAGEKDLGDHGGDKHLNEEEEKEEKEMAAKKKNEIEKKVNALKKAGPHLQNQTNTVKVDLAMDQVRRGKARYGSK